MPFNGSGGFTIINTFVPGTTILSSAVNQNYSDIATTGLSNCLTKDGQQVWGNSQNAGNFKITNLAGGSGTADSVNVGQVPGLAIPVGTVVDYANIATPPPTGWHLCYGQGLSTTTYAELFVVLGYYYGGAGATFNLPDYRGYVLAGLDNMGGSAAGRIGTVVTDSGTINGSTLGSAGGSSTHVQTSGELATHNHSATSTDSGHTHTSQFNNSSSVWSNGTNPAVSTANAGSGATVTTSTGTANITTNIGNAGSSSAMALLQPTIMVNKIIFANA